MLRSRLIHPDILRALAAAGHGSTVLVSDGNFPHATAPRESAPRVFLGLTVDQPTVTDVLDVLVESVPIEGVTLMTPEPDDPSTQPPPAHAAILARLPRDVEVERIGRHAFYERTLSPSLALVVATGDSRPYANALLRIGVVSRPSD